MIDPEKELQSDERLLGAALIVLIGGLVLAWLALESAWRWVRENFT